MNDPKSSITGILYLVSTPIGNMEDITLRAIRILSEVEFIACEDTRKTGLLLNKIREKFASSQKPQLISFYEENEQLKISCIYTLLKNGKNVALVSNAGTPTISDPGYKLVRLCIDKNIEVVSVPGPTALVSALVSSGFPTDKFLFLGFLPKKQSHRKKLFDSLYQCTSTIVQNHLTIIFYESPFRILKSLKDISEIFGDTEVVVCKELTKIHEEIIRNKISSQILYFTKNPPKGEYTIVFEVYKNPRSYLSCKN